MLAIQVPLGRSRHDFRTLISKNCYGYLLNMRNCCTFIVMQLLLLDGSSLKVTMRYRYKCRLTQVQANFLMLLHDYLQ